MKRALAERAKQSVVARVDSTSGPTQLGGSVNSQSSTELPSPAQPLSEASAPPPVSSPLPTPPMKPSEYQQSPSQPPKKIAKIEGGSQAVMLPPDPAPSSSADASNTTQPRAGGGGVGHKRPREHDHSNSSLGADSSSNAFYLKHQNRALAVELNSLKHSVQLLERERDQRRQDCHNAAQALHRFRAAWTVLETALSQPSPGNDFVREPAENFVSEIPVPSTGTGDSVEWSTSLLEALEDLGGCDTDTGVATDAERCSRIATNLAARITILQERLRPLIYGPGFSISSHEAQREGSFTATVDRDKELHEQIEEVRLRNSQIEELKASRDAAVSSERKMRRNVYRLAASMINVDQLMGAIQDDTEVVDADLQHEIVKQKLLKQELDAPTGSGSRTSNVDEEGQPAMGSESSKVVAHVSSARIDAMQTRISDLERTVTNRDEAIEQVLVPPQLTKQLGDKEQKVTELTVTQRSKGDVEKLETWERLSRKLELSEAAKKTLMDKLLEMRESWAQSRGDRDSALQSAEEQHAKFNRRWAELVRVFVPGSGGCENGDDDFDALLTAQSEAQVKEVVELQHKLSQALENVRQSESSRHALKDALTLNESLQAKLDDLKAKYTSLRNSTNHTVLKGSAPSESSQPVHSHASSAPPGVESAREAPKESSEASAKGAPLHSGTGGPNPASDKVEKLQREHRRMRKEITAVVASKDAAKARLEKVEKERDSLMESNSRLLKQMTEKDEMNAKSLSTILHLKNMTEELKKERDSLEEQAKSASQLALTARLASNAKDRVSEESFKEKELLEARVETLESKLAESKSRLDAITVELSSVTGKTTTVNAELTSALNRCQELLNEIEKKNAEIRELTDAVGKAERETRDLAGKVEKLMKFPGGDASSTASGVTSFTVDQLNTQISVLKSRLACPVCHYRDKECIIMRCRHMHCKQCVEERITNRSRKCPTCNNKFSEKDVEDVWLN